MELLKITAKSATGMSEEGHRGPVVTVVLAKWVGDDEPGNTKVETGYMEACKQNLRSPNATIYCIFLPLRGGGELIGRS